MTLTSSAELSGNITSRSANINGKVVGDIIATEFVVIKSDAVIYGNIRTNSINVEPGSIINGKIWIEGNIDERDLFEKVENRLPPKIQKKITPKPNLISEAVEDKQELVIMPISQPD